MLICDKTVVKQNAPLFPLQPPHQDFIMRQSRCPLGFYWRLHLTSWSATGNWNNVVSCWSGLSNTRPLSPLLWLECSSLLEWRGTGTKTEAEWKWWGGEGKNLWQKKLWGWKEKESNMVPTGFSFRPMNCLGNGSECFPFWVNSELMAEYEGAEIWRLGRQREGSSTEVRLRTEGDEA